MIRAAAVLDPGAGRIAGFVGGTRGKPGRARFWLGGEIAHDVVALSPITALSPEALRLTGPPPTAFCAFSARLPADLGDKAEAGADLVVEALGAPNPLLTHRFADRRELARYLEGAVMADSAELRIIRLEAGVFTGRFTLAGGGPPPEISLWLKGERIGAAELTPRGDHYAVSAALPGAALGDGVSVVDFRAGDETLASYPIAAGEALAGDLAAEVGSLRAELDQLKRAFRETLAGGVIARDERPMILAELLIHVDNLFEARDRAAALQEIGELDEEENWEIEE